MLTAVLDSFGFLSVILRGAALALQSAILGGIFFAAFILTPSVKPEKAVMIGCRRLIFWFAIAFGVIECCYLGANSAVLIIATGLRLRDVVGAAFFLAGSAGVFAACVIVALTARREWKPGAAWFGAGALVLGSLVFTSHATGRLEGRPVLLALTALHQGAVAAWVGGLPYLLLALARSSDIAFAQRICRRFSRAAMWNVLALTISGGALAVVYVGSPGALYGTAYGLMVAAKVVMMTGLLLLGGLNFLIVRRLPVTAGQMPRLRRFVEAELGIGVTVILAAASLSSQPPAVDLAEGRLTAAEIAGRMSPRWPTLATPPVTALSPATPLDPVNQFPGLQSFVPGDSYTPNTPADIAWSEYNHHWAGIIVLVAGLLAVAARYRLLRQAHHWPLAFLGLAVFLFLRADPENWPLGPRSFWQSFAVAEVLQHRVFVLLITAFSIFQWGVETGRIVSRRCALIFPLVCAAGGALLLTHSHPLGNIKEELFAELSHTPLAILGILAGWTRWLELRMPGNPGRILPRIWPVCFVLVGLILLNYREA